MAADLDARTLADALWLAAAHSDGDEVSGAPSASSTPGSTAHESDSASAAGHSMPAPKRTTGGAGMEVSARHPGGTARVRGVPLSLGRAEPLPEALAIGRALQPFRRPWRRGGRTQLDIEATVEHYARGGPLVPLFRPAPEPWFEAVIVVDTSLSMSVWEETAHSVTKLLSGLGAFRAVQTWQLDWRDDQPQLRDHHGRTVPADRAPHHGSGTQGRRLILTVSDCAARGWHQPLPWQLLSDWGQQVPVVLLDPLPQRLWRRSALNLPAVRAATGQTGDRNGALRFRIPTRLRPRPGRQEDLGPWQALPVVSCTPHSLGAWADMLMRADPRGCDAVLIPATGRIPRETPVHRGTGPTPRTDPAALAEAFVRTAPAPAVRLAILCSSLPELALPLLNVLRDEAVPEAQHSDLAEVLTSGLFTVTRDPGHDPVLTLHAEAREGLRAYLTTHDEWQALRAFDRHVAAHPYAPQGIAAVLHDPRAAAELPAQLRPFAKAAASIRHGLTPGPSTAGESTGPSRADGSGEQTARLTEVSSPHEALDRRRVERSDTADEVSAVHAVIQRKLRVFFAEDLPREPSLDNVGLLLRHLLDFVHARLPVPPDGRSSGDTYLDEHRAADGRLSERNAVDAISRHLTARGLSLEGESPAAGPVRADLVWRVDGGLIPIDTKALTSFSWEGVASAWARQTREATGSVPVSFLVVLDNSETAQGPRPLHECAEVLVTGHDRTRRALVALCVQTRPAGTPSDSHAPSASTTLADALRALHMLAGAPPYRVIVRHGAAQSPPVRLSTTYLSDWLNGRTIPAAPQGLHCVTTFLRHLAGLEEDHAWSPERFEALRRQMLRERRQRTGEPTVSSAAGPEEAEPVFGVRVADLTDSLAAHIHPAIDVVPAGQALPTLPPFFVRAHDRSLRAAVRRSADGTSMLVMLVGRSVSGKTRSCWEALHTLPPEWRVWDPVSHDLLAAALDAPASIRPGTVIWLDDAERYLLPQGDDREEDIAARLRMLVANPRNAPVLILGTLWPQHWETLTATPAGGPDPHAHARALLSAGVTITVPSRFSAEEQRALQSLSGTDPRLAQAAEGAQDSHVIRYLTLGATPTERYSQAPATARALLDAAIDARRFGHGPALPLALLEAAAPGYLTTTERATAPDNWLESAVAYSADTRQGADTVLSHVRPPDGDTRSAPPHYKLADQLERYGRESRSTTAPPDTLWTAIADHGTRTDLPAIARAAEAQGYTPHAVRLYELAARAGDTVAADELARLRRRGGAEEAALDAIGDEADLGPLAWLQRTDLSADQARNAAEQALAWLHAYGATDSARFFLNALLARSDLSPEQARDTVEQALSWLQAYGATESAQFVLRRLLERADLAPGPAREATELGLAWLHAHGGAKSAAYVLRPLLRRTDLSSEQARDTEDQALAWLHAHGSTDTAQFVLNALLQHANLAPQQSAQLTAIGIAWLDRYGNTDDASFILRPLLQRTDMSPDHAQHVVEQALAWLQEHGSTDLAQFVLNALLARADLPPEQAHHAAEQALTWLQEHGTTDSARFVLRPLLNRNDLTTQQLEKAEEIAAAWLDTHGTHDSHESIRRALLARSAEVERRATVDGPSPTARPTTEGALQYCAILVVDAANFGRHTTPYTPHVRRTMYEAVDRALEAAGAGTLTALDTIDRGDGFIRLFPPDAPHVTLVTAIMSRLQAELVELHRREKALGTGDELRLRIALHTGAVVRDAHGWAGADLNTASRLVDSQPLRAALDAGTRSPFALAISDRMYGELVRTPQETGTAFRAVRVRSKDRVLTAWIHVPGYEQPPGIDDWAMPPEEHNTGREHVITVEDTRSSTATGE
ncbi:SAV_2336 N-terminal domain-related protein [Streptomyces sp. SD15]